MWGIDGDSGHRLDCFQGEPSMDTEMMRSIIGPGKVVVSVCGPRTVGRNMRATLRRMDLKLDITLNDDCY